MKVEIYGRRAIAYPMLHPRVGSYNATVAMESAAKSDSFDLYTKDLKETLDKVAPTQKLANFKGENPTVLGRANLGLFTFCAANHPVESCGSNGLPLTPNSIQILGKFHSLSQLEHQNLCGYVEISRIQHGMLQSHCFISIVSFIFLFLERLMLVTEHYSTSLRDLIKNKKIFGLDLQIHIAKSIIEAVAYLHSQNVIHRNFHSKNVLVSPEGEVKLSAYGMYYMTRSGTLVSFPIG